MKKGFLFIAILCTLLLTGCGNKKLVCTMKQENLGMEMETTSTVYFNPKGKASKIEMNMVVDAKTEEKAKQAFTSLKSLYSDIQQDGNKIIIKETITPNKDDKEMNRKEAKKELTSQGFTCK